MKHLLEYRDSSYFNDTDYFLALNNLGQFYLTDLEPHNGKWFPKAHMGFKGGHLYDSGHWRTINKFYNKGFLQINMTTMPTINCNELYGMGVYYRGTLLKGRLTNFILGNFGVNWDNGQGKLHRQYGFPYFWNEPYKLELLSDETKKLD